MGRKKKSFIDMKHAQTYRLVPRSQQDPLAENIDESQYVLHSLQVGEPVQHPFLNEENRFEEQMKYGIDYNDEYDYLQHLKEPGTAVLEPVVLPSGARPVVPLDDLTNGKEADKKITLPVDLFGSEIAMEGHLNKIVPVSGPRPDWDPDIVAALEETEISEDTNIGDLDDDFVLQANAGEPGVPVYVSEDSSNVRSSVGGSWWKTRVDFDVDSVDRQHMIDDSSDVDSDFAEPGLDDDAFERKSARFTHYSLSSSVVPRSEALTHLDDKFEEFMATYDDSELGAPEEGVANGKCNVGERRQGLEDYDRFLIQSALEDFDKNFKHQLQNMDEFTVTNDLASASPSLTPVCIQRHSKLSESGEEVECESSDEEMESDSDDDAEGDSGGSSEESIPLMEVAERHREQWDCESILSTYSNLYNHPTKIREPRLSQQTNSKGEQEQIKLSSKTNVPLGIIPGPLRKEKVLKQVPTSRPRNEDKDEKKFRKMAVKEDRKQRRAEKKATKLAFKSESLRLEKQLGGHLHTAPVV